MNDLNCLKEKIEELSKFHQVEILKILKYYNGRVAKEITLIFLLK